MNSTFLSSMASSGLSKNLLTSNEDKNILLIWSPAVKKLLLFNSKLVQKNLANSQGKDYPSKSYLLASYSTTFDFKFEVSQILLNESGDRVILASRYGIYLAHLNLPESCTGLGFNGSKVRQAEQARRQQLPMGTASEKDNTKSSSSENLTFKPKKIATVPVESSTGGGGSKVDLISNSVWISSNRFAFIQNYQIKIYDYEIYDHPVQTIKLSESHQVCQYKLLKKKDILPKLCYSKELNGFLFLDDNSGILLYKVSSFRKGRPKSYKLVPEIENLASKNSKLEILNWCGQTILTCCSESSITHICLVEDEADQSQSGPITNELETQQSKSSLDLDKSQGTLDHQNFENLVFWAFESLNLGQDIEDIFVDQIVKNRYYLTSKGNIYSVSLPVGLEDEDELPAADVQHIFHHSTASSHNFLQGLTTSLNKIFAIIQNKFYLLPKVSVSQELDSSLNISSSKIADSKTSSSNKQLHSAPLPDFKTEILKILKRDQSQPILAASANSNAHDDPIQLAKNLRSAIEIIKSQYLDKQALAKSTITNKQAQLLQNINLIKDSNNSIKATHRRLIGNAESLADKITNFSENQEEFDSKIRKVRNFNWCGEDLSRSERCWLEQAERIQEKLYEYKLQIGQLQIKLKELQSSEEQLKNQQTNLQHQTHSTADLDLTHADTVSDTSVTSLTAGQSNSKSYRKYQTNENFKNSLQYSQVEGNLAKNTNDLEALVNDLKGMSIQANCY